MSETPTFNLWSEPWITVETTSGVLETVGLADLLANAHRFHALVEPSPLVVVGIHRLLVAILQDIIRPTDDTDLLDLWDAAAFPPQAIAQFGREYAGRFDLFSNDAPFMQSADIPRDPEKRGKGKSVGYLLVEQTTGTAVTHYHHLYEDQQMLCAVCCAGGLLTVPAFALSDGKGFRPSINGVPPIYLMPGGDTLYHSLIASLVTPSYQPTVADREHDTPWWRRDPVVGKGVEVTRVGYLHSLTFPARQIRLHPEQMTRPCSRCGRVTDWGVTEMVYEMGESRPKDAAFWQDPFAAYRITNKGPLPIRPVPGRAVWREFAGLFLPQDSQGGDKVIRPAVVAQYEAMLEELPFDPTTLLPFQVVGLRTDKAKVFEWEQTGFRVPPTVLSNVTSGLRVAAAIEFAVQGEGTLKIMYRTFFSGSSITYPDAASVRGSAAGRARMLTQYWQRLGTAFQQWITQFGPQTDADGLLANWADTVVRTGDAVFREAAEQLNNGNSTALICEQAINHCHNTLAGNRNKLISQEATP